MLLLLVYELRAATYTENGHSEPEIVRLVKRIMAGDDATPAASHSSGTGSA
ncbi:hypothetical protein SAMN05518847_11916 [Paenibacillus sp. OV219]|nr:hypothetical protein SAMN05518847_11916 [Paenibacillus sp. OV219]